MDVLGFILIVATILVVLGILWGKRGVFEEPSAGEIKNDGLRDPGKGPG